MQYNDNMYGTSTLWPAVAGRSLEVLVSRASCRGQASEHALQLLGMQALGIRSQRLRQTIEQ